MTPDYERSAIKATETLIKYGINTAPVIPLPIFKRTPGVLVLSFAEMSEKIGIERNNLVTLFGLEHQDAVTSVEIDDGKLRYLVAYNQRLPFYMLQRSLARELGHIILGHDGSLSSTISPSLFIRIPHRSLISVPSWMVMKSRREEGSAPALLSLTSLSLLFFFFLFFVLFFFLFVLVCSVCSVLLHFVSVCFRLLSLVPAFRVNFANMPICA